MSVVPHARRKLLLDFHSQISFFHANFKHGWESLFYPSSGRNERNCFVGDHFFQPLLCCQFIFLQIFREDWKCCKLRNDCCRLKGLAHHVCLLCHFEIVNCILWGLFFVFLMLITKLQKNYTF